MENEKEAMLSGFIETPESSGSLISNRTDSVYSGDFPKVDSTDLHSSADLNDALLDPTMDTSFNLLATNDRDLGLTDENLDNNLQDVIDGHALADKTETTKENLEQMLEESNSFATSVFSNITQITNIPEQDPKNLTIDDKSDELISDSLTENPKSLDDNLDSDNFTSSVLKELEDINDRLEIPPVDNDKSEDTSKENFDRLHLGNDEKKDVITKIDSSDTLHFITEPAESIKEIDFDSSSVDKTTNSESGLVDNSNKETDLDTLETIESATVTKESDFDSVQNVTISESLDLENSEEQRIKEPMNQGDIEEPNNEASMGPGENKEQENQESQVGNEEQENEESVGPSGNEQNTEEFINTSSNKVTTNLDTNTLEEDFPEKAFDKDKSFDELLGENDKEKEEGPANTIEYVELDEQMEEEERQMSEVNPLNRDKDENESEYPEKDNESHLSITNSMETTELTNDLEDDETQRDNPLFESINIEKDDSEKDPGGKDDLIEEDPMADSFITGNEEGADEELCIIPDTQRVLSQAEKEAAFSIPPLRDLTEASASTDSLDAAMDDVTQPPPEMGPASSDKFIIAQCNTEERQTCKQCVLKRKVQYTVSKDDTTEYLCTDTCFDNFKSENSEKYLLKWEMGEIRVKDLTSAKEVPKTFAFERKCVVCKKKADDEENNLTWEIMDFCNEFCLSKYQKEIGSVCASCSSEVRPNSLGKYCVRFGNDIRQFCSSHCLEEYKKGLKVCSYCQQDMSGGGDGFLAPVGDKGQFKDFCSQRCMEKYDVMTNNRPPKVDESTKCSVCKTDNRITIEYDSDGTPNYFCSERCFVAFSFVNNITPSKCSMCRRYFPNEVLEKNTMFYDNVQYSFCSNSCQNIYIIAHRKIVPCVWCKVKKYNFDMIRRYFKTGPVLNMCSINCLSLFQVSVNAVHSKKTICNFCNKRHQPMYHLTMSDATIRNFCSYSCVMSFQNKFKKSPITLNNTDDTTCSYPVPAGEPKKNQKFAEGTNAKTSSNSQMPVISSVQSLANKNGTFTPAQQNSNTSNRTPRKTNSSTQHVVNSTVEAPPIVKIKHHVIIKPPPVPDQRNVATMCKLKQHHKSTTMRPIMIDRTVQTDEHEAKKVLIPVPIPIYIPAPLPMYSVPVPYPLPFPVPIPVPIFIPTTRNSAKGIMKEIKKIQVKIPSDPYEAELLMMAEMVAGDKKEDHTDSESDVDDTGPGDEPPAFSPEPVDATNTFGDDMLQMALKMATELEEPAVDLEGALTANTITAAAGTEPQAEEAVDDPPPIVDRQPFRGRKRGRGRPSGGGTKRKKLSQPVEMPVLPPQVVTPTEPAEKPDAHLCLKYTFGVNAWKQWVTTKNAELEKSTKYVKPFKTEILQLTSDELNFSLCLFVKEVRKPNGAEYAPDTIYYLCLGIQQYLFENNRIDNIFCDPYYEQFTDSLDEVARKFSVLYNDSHYIVTRVEEEHLWESKQLGAHSPHVLLSTLMFFNTKHFNLTTVQEHMQLSFSHIMKHWKRNPSQAGVARTPGSRNVLLRFYPPQTAIQNNTRKKKVYEQQENDENPLRCPVKLYEFYLSKCPESVKTRNDVFYLQPERSCVPDSPVWYSTTALPQESLEKMLHRVKMVKEINVALLTS